MPTEQARFPSDSPQIPPPILRFFKIPQEAKRSWSHAPRLPAPLQAARTIAKMCELLPMGEATPPAECEAGALQASSPQIPLRFPSDSHQIPIRFPSEFPYQIPQ